MTHRRVLAGLIPLMLILLALSDAPMAQLQIAEINPSASTLSTSDPDGASGGRVNGLARADAATFYAASEWGGLYKSVDTGRTWSRVDAHLPVATWDVEVSPADPKRVVVTSFYDGKVQSLAGINVSADSTKTWTHPATARPAAGFCLEASRRDEPSAFGISFDPNNAANVYVGTNCGLAISNDAGITWRFVDPTPADPADDVWDVVVHHGGVIDVCGDDGHRRSTNGGATWAAAATTPLPSGMCSIAASPAEPYVLFAVSGTLIFETDDGGRNWSTRLTNRSPQGRVPFVAVNPRSGAAFDLWFGDVELWRASCTTPSAPAEGGTRRCPANTWSGPFTRDAGAHDDSGDILFASAGGCPVLFASDGGVFFNSKTASPDCHTPAWREPTVTPHGLWLFGMAGTRRPGQAGEDLYLGAQDNGAFASTDGGASWTNADCCDSFDDSASADRVLYTTCCFGSAPANRIFVRSPGMRGGGALATMPPGKVQGWITPDVIDRFGRNAYVVVTQTGVYVTKNITAATIVWTRLGAAPAPASACSVRVSGDEVTPTFTVTAGACSGRQADALWQYTGTTSTATWRRINPPGNSGGFGVVAADRNDARHLVAAHLLPAGPKIVMSVDGGTTWTTNAALDALMTGNGQYRSQTKRGPVDFTAFGPYVQPTLLAIDPADRNTIIAGAADAGIFLSRDHGATWSAVTNSSGTTPNPVVPRPAFAHFSRQADNASIYVGSQGRGIWRIQYKLPTQPSITPPSGRRAP
jgi:photosystem II stability/assembly factor-like uncharacterized protein